jgi:hypothetical protein
MLSTGRRALVGVLAGGAWIAWGLIMARALTPPILTAAILAACLLLVGCGWCIFQGYRSSATGQGSKRGKVNVGFMIVVMFEALAVGCAIFLAQRLERIDLVPDWIGIAVGLHFFGLAEGLSCGGLRSDWNGDHGLVRAGMDSVSRTRAGRSRLVLEWVQFCGLLRAGIY